MLTLSPVEPAGINPFTLANDPNVSHWHSLVQRVTRAKRILCVTGAGISVEAGIPDFRSEKGLYNLVKKKYPSVVVKGKDLFDASLFRDPTSTQVFYTFMGELSVLCSKARITQTHHFVKFLKERGTLQRWYTQNIDGLEDRVLGSVAQVEEETVALALQKVSISSKNSPGNRKTKDQVKSELVSSDVVEKKTSVTVVATRGASTSDKYPTVIQLHGSLEHVKCTLCSHRDSMSSKHVSTFRKGQAPACPNCFDIAETRQALGKRALSMGTLRPDVVLYNENHSDGERIADVIQKDSSKKPQLLLVMGTSLKVAGIRQLVKNIGKLIQEKEGFVVLINDSYLGKEWDGVFTHWIRGKCDATTSLLKSCIIELERKPITAVPRTPKKTAIEIGKENQKVDALLKSRSKKSSPLGESKKANIVLSKNVDKKSANVIAPQIKPLKNNKSMAAVDAGSLRSKLKVKKDVPAVMKKSSSESKLSSSKTLRESPKGSFFSPMLNFRFKWLMSSEQIKEVLVPEIQTSSGRISRRPMGFVVSK